MLVTYIIVIGILVASLLGSVIITPAFAFAHHNSKAAGIAIAIAAILKLKFHKAHPPLSPFQIPFH